MKIKGSLGTSTFIEYYGEPFKGSKQQRKYEKRSRQIDNPCKGCEYNMKGYCNKNKKWISNVKECEYFD